MKAKLIIVMDNGTKYEYFKDVDIDIDNHNESLGEIMQNLGFVTECADNATHVVLGFKSGNKIGNVVIVQSKVSNFEFIWCEQNKQQGGKQYE